MANVRGSDKVLMEIDGQQFQVGTMQVQSQSPQRLPVRAIRFSLTIRFSRRSMCRWLRRNACRYLLRAGVPPHVVALTPKARPSERLARYGDRLARHVRGLGHGQWCRDEVRPVQSGL